MDAPTTRLRVRVSPGASRSEVVGRHGDGWKVRVGAPPEDGKANRAVVELLAESLAVPAHAVEIASGHGSRSKTVLVHGLSTVEVEERMSGIPAGAR